MGTWNNNPWDNDAAADWYGELFDKTRLSEHVESTLKRDVQDSHEEIRAAASVLLMLGRVYVWPVEKLDAHLELASAKLEAILNLDAFEECPEIKETIRVEITELRSRLQKPAPTPPKKWWQFWKS